MKKVLIVSPHFPPINAPDMQRVRLALPHLRARGWEPTVLAVAPDFVEGAVLDPRLEATYPPDIRVVRVGGVRPQLTRWAGVGSLWLRCGRAVARAGTRLLREEKFDAVLFSTTKFNAFELGPRWRREFGVPFVVDYQDPWVNDYYDRTGTVPPGGKLKYAFAQWTARRAEPRVLREAAAVISVSDSYPLTLARHYPWLERARVHVLPFGAATQDFEAVSGYRPAQPLVNFADGGFHHVYTGRCGPDMAAALAMLFRAFRRYRITHPAAAAKMRFHFIGTDYAPPPLGRDSVRPIAEAEGVADCVHEHRYRVPYFDALYYLRHASALVAVGSDDPTYSASKIYPYVLARRPLLLIFHRHSLVLEFAERVAAGERFAFGAAGDIDAVAAAVYQRWFVEEGWQKPAAYHREALAPFLAEAMTAKLAAILDEAAGGAPLPAA